MGLHKAQVKPFCSGALLISLIFAWAAEEHAIAGNPPEDDLFSGELPPRQY
jgi:endogenous inhibitor of DNA gyrase (YacG/DUF329 family)